MTNLSPLPFYSSLKEQNHRRNYAYDAVFPLVAHRDYFMPFQFVLPGSVAIGTVTMHDVSGTQDKVLTSAVSPVRGIQKKRKQAINFPTQEGLLPNMLIKTNVGLGKIEKLSVYLHSGISKAELRYGTE